MIDHEAAHLPVVEEHVLVIRLHLRIGAVAIVVELLLAAEQPGDLAIPGSGRRPLASDIGVHPLVVRLAEERQVVRLKTRATPVLSRLPEPESVVLCQAGVKTVALQRARARPISCIEQSIGGVAAVRALEVVRARLLCCVHHRCRPCHVRKQCGPDPRILTLAPAVIPVDPRFLGMAAQPVAFDRVAELTLGGGEARTDRRRTLVEILLDAPDQIVCQRLYLLSHLRPARRAQIARRLPAGYGVEQADRVPARSTAGDFTGTEDRGVVRRIREAGDVTHVWIELRRPTDATRVVEIETRRVAAEEAVEIAEVECVAAGDEERTLLLIVRLVRRQVDRRGIDLDLTEVGVDGRIERETRREQILHVSTGAHLSVVAVVVWISRLSVLELLAGFDIRQQLELARLWRDSESIQGSVVRRATGLAQTPERPHVLLVQTIRVPQDLQAPALDALSREPKL